MSINREFKNKKGKGERILIVDDRVDIQIVLTELLKGEGYEVTHSWNGKAAITLGREFNPQLIIMDLMMPIMSGWDAIHEFRAETQFSNIPIIALTAVVPEKEKDSVLALGFNAYISKPFDDKELLEIIEKLLEESKDTSK